MSFVTRLNSFRRLKSGEFADGPYQLKKLEEHHFFFDRDDIAVMKGSVAKLGEMGGVQGLAAAFRTDLKHGLLKDEMSSSFERRREIYGRNVFERPPPTPFLVLCWEALQDPMLIILIIAGIVSIVAGSIAHPSDGWIEGSAILLAVAIVTLVGAYNDWNKEKQFRSMDEKKEDKQTLVIRDGLNLSVSTKDINVGDLMVLRSGSMIPADGVYVGGDNVQTNEAKMTGENLNIKKNFSDPFVLSGTEVVDGEGLFLAIAVGPHSEWGIIMSKVAQERDPTPLQMKLERMATVIGWGGAAVAVLLFVILLLRNFIDENSSLTWTVVLNSFIIAVTIVVVAVPEGLPLAVTISLAYSMKKMVLDNIFVRVLSACETMGNATQICSDKTGTLTKNVMSVTNVFLAGREWDHLPGPEELNANVLKLASEGIALNSKVFVIDSSTTPPKLGGGNQTECALLQWIVTSFDTNYELLRSDNALEKVWPFSSKTKRSGVLYQKKDGGYRLYLKGAAERIVGGDDEKEAARFCLKEDGTVMEMDAKFRRKAFDAITTMTKTGLRCIGMSYQDLATIEHDHLDELIDPKLDALVLIGVCGIKDPVRDEVPAAVKTCQDAGIVVRMVTGDHLETAKFISRECGILTDEANQGAYLGEEFRHWTPEEAEELIPSMRVLARSKPSDKEKLVKWLKEHDDVVAVTGDGTNDAPALSAANVGLSMGIQGTDVAKDASDIIIMDDNFTSIVKAIMWGRTVYDNIRKFVQFQLTVNVVALTIALIGAFTKFETPLKAVQLLWVNLIMDTMAALALGTELPTIELLNRRPYRLDASLISRIMWKNIFSQSALQLCVLIVVLFVDIWPNWSTQQRLTTLFNSFVFLQFFNEINSRKVNGELNVFENFFSNTIFLGVLAFTAFLQVLMVEVFGDFASTTGIAWDMWLFSIGVGALSIPFGALGRFVKVDNSDGFVRAVEDDEPKGETKLPIDSPV